MAQIMSGITGHEAALADNPRARTLILVRGMSGTGKSALLDALRASLPSVHDAAFIEDTVDAADAVVGIPGPALVIASSLFNLYYRQTTRPLPEGWRLVEVNHRGFTAEELRARIPEDPRISAVIDKLAAVGCGSIETVREILHECGESVDIEEYAGEAARGYIMRHCNPPEWARTITREEQEEILALFLPPDFGDIGELIRTGSYFLDPNLYGNVTDLSPLQALSLSFHVPDSWERYRELASTRRAEPLINIVAWGVSEDEYDSIMRTFHEILRIDGAFPEIEFPDFTPRTSRLLVQSRKSGILFFESPSERHGIPCRWNGFYGDDVDREFVSFVLDRLNPDGGLLFLRAKEHSVTRHVLCLPAVMESILQERGIEYAVEFPEGKRWHVNPAERKASLLR